MAKPKTRAQLDREIAAFLAKGVRIRRSLPPSSRYNTPEELAKRARGWAQIKKIDAQVAARRPPPPEYPEGTGIWRRLDD